MLYSYLRAGREKLKSGWNEMALLEKQLAVKRSGLPGAGKGLFTKKFIPKGTKIVEYKGKVSSWKNADHRDGGNGYIYYVKRYHVIDALPRKAALARYANDARGLIRLQGVTNNAEYVEEGLSVYIQSTKDIPAGSEIFVGYGKEYWDVMKSNAKLEEKQPKEQKLSKKKKVAKKR